MRNLSLRKKLKIISMKKNFILPILMAAVALFEFFTIKSLLDAANAWNKFDLVTINIDPNWTILKT